MQIDLLRSFLAVAETGGFSAAARALNLTQSAVSLQIKRLEEQTGVDLFQRNSRKVILTEEGGALLPYARRFLNLQESARSALANTRLRPAVRVGISDEQAECYLPEILPVFTRRFPKARLEIICDISTELVEYLQQGLLDLALSIRHGTEATGEIIGSEELVWVAGENFKCAPREPLPLALNPEGCIYRTRALDVLARIGRRWNLMYVSKSPTGINMAVTAGIAVTVKAARSIPSGCRVLSEADGLPALAPVAVELHRAHTAGGPECEAFAGLLQQAAGRTINML